MPSSPPFRSFAIIPAAGHSRRMGRPKLLLRVGGARVIDHLLHAWADSLVTCVVIVARQDDTPLLAACREYGIGIDLAVPATAPPEMKDSVAAGLAHVAAKHAPGAGDVWLLAPADMPRLSSDAIDRLLAAHDPARPAILRAAYRGKAGHPALFPWPTAEEVFRLAEDQGVNELLARHGSRLVDVDEAGVLFDLDTPDDLRRWQAGE